MNSLDHINRLVIIWYCNCPTLNKRICQMHNWLQIYMTPVWCSGSTGWPKSIFKCTHIISQGESPVFLKESLIYLYPLSCVFHEYFCQESCFSLFQSSWFSHSSIPLWFHLMPVHRPQPAVMSSSFSVGSPSGPGRRVYFLNKYTWSYCARFIF